MALTRKQSRVLAIGILLLFFVIVISLVPGTNIPETSKSIRLQPNAANSANSDEPKSQFSLRDFNRSEIKDGKKVWEVKAALGEYFPSTNSVKLSDATLWLYPKDDKKPNPIVPGLGSGAIVLKSKEAVLTIDGTTLQQAEVHGDVEIVYNDKVTLHTQKAVYNKAEELVLVPGAVTISSEEFTARADSLKANVLTHEVTLSKNVKTELRGRIADVKK